MFSKRTTAAFWNEDLLTSHLIGVTSKGVDKAMLEKLGSAGTPFGSDIRPEPGYAFVHVITNGAGEAYGANDNRDWFNESAREFTFKEAKKGASKKVTLKGGLKEYHKTYRQYGGVYRNHRNSHKTDPSTGKPFEKQGEIADEQYNEPMRRGELIIKLPEEKWGDLLQKIANNEPVCWSMGCFRAGTPVLLANGVTKCIETIVPGDRVLSHTGKSVEVTGVRKLSVATDMYKVKAACVVPFECTGNHPHLIIKKESIMKDSMHVRTDISWDDTAWVETDKLNVGDYMVMPVPKLGTKTLPVSLAKMIGWYIAEGDLLYTDHSNSYAVRWNTGMTDLLQYDIEDLCSDFETEHKPRIHCNEAKHGVAIRVTSKKLYTLLEPFGKGAYNKRFCANWMEYSEETLKTILGSYLEGDGCFYISKRKGGSIPNLYASTCNEELAIQIQQLGLALGGFVAINKAKHTTSKSKTTKLGYTISYQMRFDAHLTALLAPYCRKVTTIPSATIHGKGTRRILRDFAIVRITDMSVKEDTLDVFNLHVDSEEHSYLVRGIATHNCATPREICSYCGNEARKLSDRCLCLKQAVNTILEDGHVPFAINDETYYHDISEVGMNPAMKVAFTLEKVAATGLTPRKPEFNDNGLWLPLDFMKKVAAKKESHRYELLHKLAAKEKSKEVDPDLVDCMSHSSSAEKNIADQCKGIKLEDLVGNLTKNKMLLPPRAFSVIVIRSCKPEIADNDALQYASGVSDKLPSIFSKILSSSQDTEDVVSDGHYCSMCSSPLSSSKLSALSPMLSMEPEAMKKRVIIKVINGESDEGLEKSASLQHVDQYAEVLAKEYAKYQLAFLAENDSEALLETVLAQNRA